MPARDILYQSILTSVCAGQTCQNVLWFRTYEGSTYPTTQAELTDMHTNVNAWFVTNLVNFSNNNWSPVTLVSRVMAGDLPYQAISNYVNVVGIKSGDGMPPHDAAVISLYTPFHGKRLHGRIYLTGLSESDHANGLLNTLAMTNYNQVGSDLMSKFGASGSSGSVRLCVFSRANGVQSNAGPPRHNVYDVLAAIPFTRFAVANRIRTNRHRLIR